MSFEFRNKGPSLTPDRLAEVAGENLPDDYRAFMLERNGGSPSASVHLPDDDSGASVRSFLRVTDDPKYAYDLTMHIQTFRDRHPEGFLPIAVDSSGNLILLDIGYEQYGSVWFWDHEGEADDDEPPRTDNITKLTNSFTELLDNLTSEIDPELERLMAQDAKTAIVRTGTYKLDEPFTFD